MGSAAKNAEEFIIRMTQQVSGPSAQAEASLNRLELQIFREQRALRELGAESAKVGAKLSDAFQRKNTFALSPQDLAKANKEYERLTSQMAKIRAAQGQHQGALGMLSGSRGLAHAADAAKAAEKQRALTEQLEASNSALGRLVSQFMSLGNAGPIGALVAVAAILVTITVGAIAAAAAFVRLGFAMADAAKGARLLNDAATGSNLAGAELTMVIEDIASRTPVAKSRIAELGRELALAHLQGRNLQRALEAVTFVESAIGHGGAAKIQDIAKQWGIAEQRQREAAQTTGLLTARYVLTREALQGTGLVIQDVADALAKKLGISGQAALLKIRNGALNAKDGIEVLNDAIQNKFGRTIQAQMKLVSTQWSKLSENFAELFSEVDMSGISEALSTVSNLLSKNSVEGRALHDVMSVLFGTISKDLKDAGPSIRSFVIGAEIGFLKLVLMALQFRNAFLRATKGVRKDLDMVGLGTNVVVGGFGLLLGMALAIPAALLAIGYAAYAMAYPFIWIGDKIYEVSSWITDTISALVDELVAELSGGGAASVQGFVDGITSRVDDAVNAVKNLGLKSIKALRDVLGWHSPARIPMQAGKDTGEGFKIGVRSKEDEIQDTMAEAVNPTPMAGGGKGGGNWTKTPGGNYLSMDFRGAHFGGGFGEDEARALFVRVLDEALRGMEPA